jgi:hypothetical protein
MDNGNHDVGCTYIKGGRSFHMRDDDDDVRRESNNRRTRE